MSKVYPTLEKNILLLFVFFSFSILLLNGQSNTCSGPPTLTVGASCSPTNYTFANNQNITGATFPGSCSDTIWRADGYFTFTAPVGVTQISIDGTSNQLMGLALYQGNCATFQSNPIVCNTPGAASASLTNISVSPGTQYILRIGRTDDPGNGNSGMSGTICVYDTTPSLTNDDCSTATTLTVNTSCSFTTYSNQNATASTGAPLPGCASYSGGDVWFTVTVPASGNVNIDTNEGTMTDSGMAIYSGSCGSLTLIACDDDGSSNGFGTMSYISLFGRTPNEPLYIRVWSFGNNDNGTFGICAVDPGVVCNEPNIITTTSITSTTATINWTPANPVPANGYDYIISTDNTPTTPTNDITGTTTGTSVNLTNLDPDTTYYIFVRSRCVSSTYSAWDSSSFSTLVPPPSNDEPCGAIALTTNTSCSTTNHTNAGATPSSITPTNLAGCGSHDGTENDVWFTAEVGADGTLVVEALGNTSQLTDPVIALYTSFDCSSGPFNLLECDDDGGGFPDSYAEITGQTPGTTIYIRVWPWIGNNDGTFDICAYSPGGLLTCTDAPTNITITGVTGSEATVSWTAPSSPPANGYAYYVSTNGATPDFTATPTGTTTNTTVNLTGLTDSTIYYVWVRSICSPGENGVWVGPESFTTDYLPPVTTDIEVCQGSSGELQATANCGYAFTNIGNSISDSIETSDPQANRLPIVYNTTTCGFASILRHYTTIDFMVTATGTYTFSMSTGIDFQGYIVTGDFTPGSCATGTFIVGDDDSGAGLLPQLTTTLTAGVVYTLITTTYGTISSSQAYTWNISGPGNLEQATSAQIEWYLVSSGGSAIGTGSPFNPVGADLGGYLPDTNTPGEYQFYAACSTYPNIRTLSTFTVNALPTAVISGTPDCTGYEVSITLTGTGPWTVTYALNGAPQSGDILNIGDATSSSPFTHTFSSSETSGTDYTLYEVTDGNSCNATSMNGTATVSYTGCGCIEWDGGGTGDNWNDPLNWDPNGVPTLSDCVVIPDTGGSDPIILNGTTDAEAYSITINNGASITVENEMTLTVQDFINGPGTVLLQGSEGTTINTGGGGTPSSFNSSTTANLIQINDTAVNNAVITLQRHVFTRTQDYVYWSSPVAGINPFTNFGTSLVYEWDPTIYQNATVQFGNWMSPQSASMEAGKGYIARGPSGGTNENADWAMATFTGVPHNGIITQNIRRGTYTIGNPDPDVEPEDDNWNLVGNPYPSNLNADLFLQENATLIGGYINLWTHGIQIRPGNSPNFGDYVLNYDTEDYLVYNLGGSTAGGHNATFDGYLGSGQGFFVQMLDGIGTQVPSYPDEYETTIEFNNNMRTNQTEMFFRSTQQSENTSNPPTEKHRIWLDLIQPDYSYQTILVGYIQGATMYNDHFYDAKAGSTKSIYSLIPGYDETFAIQGRELPFDSSDIVSLGVTLNQVGEYAINLNSFDGLFETTQQDIFLEDLETGIIHNLRESAYFFTINETGTFNNRFLLRYTNTTLGIDDISKHEIRIIAPNNEYIKVTSGTNQIESIKVYDLLGRVLIEKQKVNATELTINTVPKTNGAYIVKAKLINGLEKIQKVVLK